MSARRIAIFSAAMAGLAAFAVLYPAAFLFSLVTSITVIYTVWGVYHVAITISGLKPPLNPDTKLDEFPKISAIIPARNEPILGRTIEVCLNHIDYPRDKKEIIVVVDDEGGERIGFWYQQKYPDVIKLLARRQLFPTKPSALNDAMRLCTGDIVVIMDVEDIPDRDVFLKAAAAIKSGWQAVQVILRIGNTEDSWISKVFAMEYAGWFRIMLNGRANMEMFAPLGGTGNYFSRAALRYVGGYEPTNLAEDAELAIRLRIARWNVGTIDARHWEEAPVKFKPWLKQRSRWFRGWMQSFWKYSGVLFKPTVARRMGLSGIFSALVMLISPLIVVLNWISYGVTAYWLLEQAGVLPQVTAGVIPFWSIIPLWFNGLYYYIWIKGAKLEGIKVSTIRILPHMFFYMNVMMPIASLRAFYQELFMQVFWEKTTHQGRGVKWKAAEQH
ncbi:MAG: glycosyltransferase [Nitrososphaera sp.]|uniref:glycosyltransferase n=1 Tax=Nitrososphaera sp. TaxID=1971748 RepID=UPI003D6F2E2F